MPISRSKRRRPNGARRSPPCVSAGRPNFPDGGAAAPDPAAEARLSAERAGRLRQLLLVVGDGRTAPSVRQQAADTLVGFGPSLVTMLEGLPPADAANLPETLYQEVLPKIHPVFVALDRLASTDVRVRRDGATNLTTALAGKPMPGLALDRLVTLGRREDDPVVWQALLQITAQDARTGAEQLAYLAVGNASSDVRRRACDYLAAHPDRRHIPVLLPMLGDASSSVAIAAVRGLGAIGTFDDPRPLVDLLLTTDRPLRLEVAVNLVKLKNDQGARPWREWRSIPTCSCGSTWPGGWVSWAIRSSCRRCSSWPCSATMSAGRRWKAWAN